MTTTERVQHEVDRLLAALLDMAVAERHGNDDGTLAGFIVGFRIARDTYLTGGPAGSAFDALEQLATAVRDHYLQECSPS